MPQPILSPLRGHRAEVSLLAAIAKQAPLHKIRIEPMFHTGSLTCRRSEHRDSLLRIAFRILGIIRVSTPAPNGLEQTACRRLLEKLKVIPGFQKEAQATAAFHRFHRSLLAQTLLPILDVIVESTMLPYVGPGLSGSDEPPAF
jgi:hypothetical protein